MLAGLLAASSLVACGGGSAGTDGARPRPTETGLHDHGGAQSALDPETVQPTDIAALGTGVPSGGRFEGFLGVNLCGRFLDLGEGASGGGIQVEPGGRLVLQPGPGDETGLEVTMADVLGLLDIRLATGRMEFGPAWAGTDVDLGRGAEPLGGLVLGTGDACGPEQGEVQLWYYTEDATNTGEGVRMVVTDPGDVPIAGDGVAVTVAFAPASSLPTLPPAVMVAGGDGGGAVAGGDGGGAVGREGR